MTHFDWKGRWPRRSSGTIGLVLLLAPLARGLGREPTDTGDLDRVRREYGLTLVRVLPQADRPAALDRLLAGVDRAERQGDWSSYYRSAGQLFAAVEGETWDQHRELAYSLRVVLEHGLIDSNGEIDVHLAQAFEAAVSLDGGVAVEISLWRRALLARGARVRRLGSIDHLAGELVVRPEKPLPPGAYEIVGRLVLGSGKGYELRSAAPLSVAPSFRESCRRIAARRRQIEGTLDDETRTALRDALRVTRYPEDLAGQFDRGLTSIQDVAVSREIAWTEETLAAIERGERPLAEIRGDARRLHRYEALDALYPYRLFVPSSFETDRRWPLIVALHGLGGDEMSWSLYGQGALFRLAARHEVIVACPLGIDRASFYVGHGQDEVFDLIDDLRARLPIDPERIYLIGHSMGGFGTISMAMERPDLFAAIAPISGGGDPRRATAIADLPQFVVHGDADRIVPFSLSRLIVEASRKAGADVTFRVVKGGGHIDVVARTLPEIVTWLLSHHR